MRPDGYTFRFVVDAACHGLRIDTFLASRLRNHVPAQFQRLAREGLVTINDDFCAADRRVFRGEEVSVRLAEPPEPFYPTERIPLEVLYDDPWLVAVHKPAGLIAHPVGPVDGGTLANAIQGLFDCETIHPGLFRPGIVHRLDRETSGVMLVAKDQAAHAELTRQFERSAVSKAYLALVAGRMTANQGVIDLPIGQRANSLLMSTEADSQAPRPAATAYRVIARVRSATLVEARPRTGRKHQIRVHLAAVGHPILGDASYGRDDMYGPNPRVERKPPASRHALHALAIAFRHPVTNAPLRVTAPPPSDFWEVLGTSSPAAAEDPRRR